MLSQNGYDVEERSVADPDIWAELEALGFDAVPVVVAEGRAFVAFPEEILRRELALPPAAVDLEKARLAVASLSSTLRIAATMTEGIPNDLWDRLIVEKRDRPLGQWVWHIFFFADLCLYAYEKGAIGRSKFDTMVDQSKWLQGKELKPLGGFRAIARYGWEVADRIKSMESIDLEALTTDVHTPFGSFSLGGFIDQALRHTAVHLRQVIARMPAWVPDFASCPSLEEMNEIPSYNTLALDEGEAALDFERVEENE